MLTIIFRKIIVPSWERYLERLFFSVWSWSFKTGNCRVFCSSPLVSSLILETNTGSESALPSLSACWRRFYCQCACRELPCLQYHDAIRNFRSVSNNHCFYTAPMPVSSLTAIFFPGQFEGTFTAIVIGLSAVSLLSGAAFFVSLFYIELWFGIPPS